MNSYLHRTNAPRLLGLFASLFLSTTFGVAKPIKIAVEGAYPPFNQVNLNGELEGFDVDVARSLCKRLKQQCEFVAVPWDGMIPGLLAKKIDVIASSMSITPERAQQVLFTQNYYRLGAVFVAEESKKIDIKNPALRVAVQRGATYEKYARSLNPKWDLKVYEKATDHNKDLALGRIDAALGQLIVMSDFIKANPHFEIKAGPFYDKEILGNGAGIAFRKEDTKLATEFDKALSEIKKNGELKALAVKYFTIDIFGPK